MSLDKVTAALLWDIFRHVKTWLVNLSRAGPQRQQQSVDALRGVIRACRETAVYMRQMQDLKARDHKIERDLARLWTDLGFALEDLGIHKLAKRCQITGRHWASPRHYDEAFLKKADVSLDSMETLARGILKQVRR